MYYKMADNKIIIVVVVIIVICCCSIIIGGVIYSQSSSDKDKKSSDKDKKSSDKDKKSSDEDKKSSDKDVYITKEAAKPFIDLSETKEAKGIIYQDRDRKELSGRQEEVTFGCAIHGGAIKWGAKDKFITKILEPGLTTFTVNPTTMGGDPIAGEIKDWTADYICDSNRTLIPTPAPTQAGNSCSSSINGGVCSEMKSNHCKAVMQGDGNFVVYSNGTKVWASDTDGKGSRPYNAVMQGDGNFVVYSNGTKVWASDTDGKGSGPYNAVMQDDCNFVVYDASELPIWNSNTSGK